MVDRPTWYISVLSAKEVISSSDRAMIASTPAANDPGAFGCRSQLVHPAHHILIAGLIWPRICSTCARIASLSAENWDDGRLVAFSTA
jgi:hypothetical protein